MEIKTLVWILIAILAFLLGYLSARLLQKTNGDIIYELGKEEDGTEIIHCTFKLDLDVDDIVKKDQILLGVKKDRDVLEYYAKS